MFTTLSAALEYVGGLSGIALLFQLAPACALLCDMMGVEGADGNTSGTHAATGAAFTYMHIRMIQGPSAVLYPIEFIWLNINSHDS